MPTAQLLNGRPVSRSTLADTVYQTILEAILSGTIRAGTEVTEVSLAAELEVSRTPVHEALKRLAADGLVEHLTNRQARVTLFSPVQIVEIYEIRLLLEPAAAERAAARLEQSQLVALGDAAEALADAVDSDDWPQRALEFDIRLHDLLAAASGNRRLHAEVAKYRRLVRALCRVAGDRHNLQQAFVEHQRILRALAARDGAGAREAMADHIQSRLAAVLTHLGANDSRQKDPAHTNRSKL